jgi:tetratricopeptide (TPR) repeat protein
MKDLMTKRTQNGLCPGIEDGYVLLDLARGWLKQGNTVVAEELLSHAIISSEADKDQGLRAQILKETGRTKMMQSDWDSSELYYLGAQRVFLEINNYKGASESARNRANMQFQKGNFSKAEELCQQALDWASEINNYELRATILNTIGAIKSNNGEFNEAIKVFRLCLADFESSGNAIRQGYVLLNIGLSQSELENHDEAISSLNKSLAIALEERDLSLVEICYQNIAKCYLKQKETNLAKSVIETARKILPGLNSKALENELELIEAKLVRLSGDLDEASHMLEETLNAAVENKLSGLVAEILNEQGLLAIEIGDAEVGRSKLDAAANQFRLVGVDKGFHDAIQTLDLLKRRDNA